MHLVDMPNGGVGMMKSNTVINMSRTGKRLQNYARAYGYNVKDIQRYLGLSCPQSVYRWFKGMILPSVDNLLKLSELFHVHMEELLVKESVLYETHLQYQSYEFERRIVEYHKRLLA
jgi:transcriptional regulator with XRE-family HTH domain